MTKFIRTRPHLFSLIRLSILLLLAFALGLDPWPQLYAQSSVTLPLSKISFTGLLRYKESEVIPVTGLRLGEVVNQDSLKGAA